MSCGRGLPPNKKTLQTYSTTAQSEQYVGWMPLIGLTTADSALDLRNVVGNFSTKPFFQTADVRPEKPNAPTAFTAGSYETTAGFVHFHETIDPSTAFWICFGAAYKNSSGSALGTAEVGLEFNVQQCGRVLGSANAAVNPGMVTTTDLCFATITGFEPTVGLSKIMAAFVVTDNETNYLEYQLFIRTAIDRRAPNAWVAMEAAYTNPNTANSERNTGELAIPAGANLTSNTFFQLAIGFRKKSGAAGNPRADIAVVTAARYA